MSVTASLPAEIMRFRPTPPERQAQDAKASSSAPLCATTDTPPGRRPNRGSEVSSSPRVTSM